MASFGSRGLLGYGVQAKGTKSEFDPDGFVNNPRCSPDGKGKGTTRGYQVTLRIRTECSRTRALVLKV